MDTKGSKPDSKAKITIPTTVSDSVPAIARVASDRLKTGIDTLRELGQDGLTKVGAGIGAKAVGESTDREEIDNFWAEASGNPDIAGGLVEIPEAEKTSQV